MGRKIDKSTTLATKRGRGHEGVRMCPRQGVETPGCGDPGVCRGKHLSRWKSSESRGGEVGSTLWVEPAPRGRASGVCCA